MDRMRRFSARIEAEKDLEANPTVENCAAYLRTLVPNPVVVDQLLAQPAQRAKLYAMAAAADAGDSVTLDRLGSELALALGMLVTGQAMADAYSTVDRRGR